MDSQITEDAVVRALAALAQPARLRAFRELVVAGPTGLNPGVLAERLEMPATTLSFHLKELVGAGLAQAERDGRFLIYRAGFGQMNALLGYLTAHCCEGASCELADADSRCAC
ncbi:ArsR/SmtB family transcription factor [Rivibacter subsaxonicus]|uniref:ArsR family transcriptional regulator n=1 Tax=Rivibacter subsaxonicus TaxID=457575 RepID=A0A4Q7VNX4_9BURK|nr:helix-turn-helix domain-containing protein [Rivibacter subsaxonicus]RZT98042.1 ArsR family transcriptional regulator [Rivibacter subsaxonicus]